MSTPASPFTDHAANILQNAAGIDDTQRADLHDIFHDSKDANELAQKLQPVVVPDQLKTDLYDAKKRFSIVGGVPGAPGAPVAPAVSKATAALAAMGQLDPRVLELAESHPKTASALISAATKEAPAPQAASKSADEGKPSPSAPATPVPAAAPGPAATTAQGGLPPIPAGHHRVMASDGGLHDIPVANIEKAKKIDPKLRILNP